MRAQLNHCTFTVFNLLVAVPPADMVAGDSAAQAAALSTLSVPQQSPAGPSAPGMPSETEAQDTPAAAQPSAPSTAPVVSDDALQQKADDIYASNAVVQQLVSEFDSHCAELLTSGAIWDQAEAAAAWGSRGQDGS